MSEPAVDEEGNPTGETKKYEDTPVSITAPEGTDAADVIVRVLVVAKDQTTHKNATASATVTFAAATTGSGDGN